MGHATSTRASKRTARAVLDAKACVLVGQRVVAGVLFPQQLQGDAGALESLVTEREVRGELVARPRHCRAEQPGLEFVVAEGLEAPNRRRPRGPATRRVQEITCTPPQSSVITLKQRPRSH